jgi:hypothetical protein
VGGSSSLCNSGGRPCLFTASCNTGVQFRYEYMEITIALQYLSFRIVYTQLRRKVTRRLRVCDRCVACCGRGQNGSVEHGKWSMMMCPAARFNMKLDVVKNAPYTAMDGYVLCCVASCLSVSGASVRNELYSDFTNQPVFHLLISFLNGTA